MAANQVEGPGLPAVVKTDKSADAGEVVRIGGLRGCRGGGHGVGGKTVRVRESGV